MHINIIYSHRSTLHVIIKTCESQVVIIYKHTHTLLSLKRLCRAECIPVLPTLPRDILTQHLTPDHKLNLNPALAFNLKPSLYPQTALWSCRLQSKFPHSASESHISWWCCDWQAFCTQVCSAETCSQMLYSHMSYAAFSASLHLERNLPSCLQPSTILVKQFEE